MRIKIAHETRYDYDRPAKSVLQVLRLTPRAFEGQHLIHWEVDVEGDFHLRAGEDALGNVTHLFSAMGPLKRLIARVSGEVETQDTGGVVRGAVERFPPQVFLRDTPLTAPDAALRAYAAPFSGPDATRLERLHSLLQAIHADLGFDTELNQAANNAADAFEKQKGIAQDLAHIFIACARLIGAPARYVSGHVARPDQMEREAAHAWAEAHVTGLGWVGFDPVYGLCPTDAYVRVAIGLDYLGAAPVRGSRFGGGEEQLDVRLRVTSAQQGQG